MLRSASRLICPANSEYDGRPPGPPPPRVRKASDPVFC
jgi:hypothetical protein